CKHYISDPFTF
nr:immunoglobulin light chain junction region [Macaca mulatta]